mmetsp:Transcript_54435/g.167575  ORF Transcript_54435/g.167575 Transcript_54435/m.167575 type:complete len:409 (-) Transcript_54435:2705-3931(-)
MDLRRAAVGRGPVHDRAVAHPAAARRAIVVRRQFLCQLDVPRGELVVVHLRAHGRPRRLHVPRVVLQRLRRDRERRRRRRSQLGHRRDRLAGDVQPRRRVHRGRLPPQPLFQRRRRPVHRDAGARPRVPDQPGDPERPGHVVDRARPLPHAALVLVLLQQHRRWRRRYRAAAQQRQRRLAGAVADAVRRDVHAVPEQQPRHVVGPRGRGVRRQGVARHARGRHARHGPAVQQQRYRHAVDADRAAAEVRQLHRRAADVARRRHRLRVPQLPRPVDGHDRRRRVQDPPRAAARVLLDQRHRVPHDRPRFEHPRGCAGGVRRPVLPGRDVPQRNHGADSPAPLRQRRPARHLDLPRRVVGRREQHRRRAPLVLVPDRLQRRGQRHGRFHDRHAHQRAAAVHAQDQGCERR